MLRAIEQSSIEETATILDIPVGTVKTRFHRAKAMLQARLADMDDGALETYDALLSENDHDLYQWVTGQSAPPPSFGPMISDIQALLARQNAGQT